MSTGFGKHNLDEHAQALADFLPDGPLFESKNIKDTGFQKLLRGFAGELFNAEGMIRDIAFDYNILVTNMFLEHWESALGMPDECFKTNLPFSERRTNILIKLASLGVQTREDFVDLATIFNLDIVITQGTSGGGSVFPLEFPVLFGGVGATPERFTIVIDFQGSGVGFPYTFPFQLASSVVPLFECLVERLIPINCEIEFIN